MSFAGAFGFLLMGVRAVTLSNHLGCQSANHNFQWGWDGLNLGGQSQLRSLAAPVLVYVVCMNYAIGNKHFI